MYERKKSHLEQILAQRTIDRAFIDEATLQCKVQNAGIDFQSSEYHTVIGQKDSTDRIVIGPLPKLQERKTVSVPDFLQGNQITLFGPPDTAKMSINAMNSLHHQLVNEDPFIAELVNESGDVPRWGADNEDSKTPIMRKLLTRMSKLDGML